MIPKIKFVPLTVYREIDSTVEVIYALEHVFGKLPLQLGNSQRSRLIAMHHAYNAGRSQHGRETPFGWLAEAIQKYDLIEVITEEEDEHQIND